MKKSIYHALIEKDQMNSIPKASVIFLIRLNKHEIETKKRREVLNPSIRKKRIDKMLTIILKTQFLLLFFLKTMFSRRITKKIVLKKFFYKMCKKLI